MSGRKKSLTPMFWWIPFVMAFLVFALASPILADAKAQEETAEGEEQEAPAASGGGLASKFRFHGFLTQAYADASFLDGGFSSPSANEQALGIPEDGTWDYRFLALQFRYQISPKDLMIVQLSSRRLGFSAIERVEDEVEIDWAFYERRLSDYTRLKVGRVQIPLGIYNEIRDVGTILPFYRPPFTFYREGSFTSETVDGVVLSHIFAPDSRWSLEADVYTGEWEQFEVDNRNLENSALARAKDAYGFQLWLNTPVTGLRLGFGGNSKRLVEGVFRAPGVKGDRIDDWYVSLDGTFDRFVVRAEAREFDPTLRLGGPPIFLKLPSRYAQLGYLATEKFQVWLQYEVSEVESDSIIQTEPVDRKDRQDLGISLNYLFRPDLVLKVEYHEVEEDQGITVPVFGPGGLMLVPQLAQADNGSYSIVSLSVSF